MSIKKGTTPGHKNPLCLSFFNLLGRIEPGRPAFLVAVEGNPWEDINAPIGKICIPVR